MHRENCCRKCAFQGVVWSDENPLGELTQQLGGRLDSTLHTRRVMQKLFRTTLNHLSGCGLKVLGVQTLFAGSSDVDIADLAPDPAHVLPARELPEVGA